MKRMQAQSKTPGAQVGLNTGDSMSHMQTYFMELSKAFGVPPTEVHSFLAPRTENGLTTIFQAHTEAKAKNSPD